MKTLYLHIGTFKTGTTSIQRFLNINQKILLEEGIFYPEKLMEGNWFEGNNGNNGNLYPLALHIRDPKVQIGIETLRKLFIQHEKILLSGEDFWGVDDKSLRLKMLKELDIKIVVLVYLRRQDKYIDSMCNQLIKSGRLSFENKEISNFDIDWFHADYYEELKKIESIIGKDNLKIRVFEKEQLYGNDLFKDFIYSLDLQFSNSYKKIKNVNESLCNKYREIRNICNLALNNSYGPKYKNFLVTFKDLSQDYLSKQIKKEESDLLPIEVRSMLMQKYNQGNQCIAKEFLGRRDGKLFFEQLIYNNEIIERGEIDVECVIKVFAKLVAYHCEEIWQIKQEFAMKENNIRQQLLDMQQEVNILKESFSYRKVNIFTSIKNFIKNKK